MSKFMKDDTDGYSYNQSNKNHEFTLDRFKNQMQNE